MCTPWSLLLRWSSWRRTGQRAGGTRRSCWSGTVWTSTETRQDSSSTPSSHTWCLLTETFSAQELSSITSGYDVICNLILFNCQCFDKIFLYSLHSEMIDDIWWVCPPLLCFIPGDTCCHETTSYFYEQCTKSHTILHYPFLYLLDSSLSSFSSFFSQFSCKYSWEEVRCHLFLFFFFVLSTPPNCPVDLPSLCLCVSSTMHNARIG